MARKRTWTGAILCLALLCCSLFMCMTTATAEQAYELQDAQGGAITYASAYCVGDTVAITQGQFVDGDNKYPASATVRYPSGASRKVASIAIQEIGTYTVTYSAKIGGKTQKKSFAFLVERPAYEIDGAGSIEAGAVRSEYSEELPDAQGVNVSLKNGATFKYNKILNVKDHRETKATSLDVPIVKFYCTPDEKVIAQSEVLQIYVRLTDLHDPQNFIEVRYNQLEGDKQFNPHFSYTNARAGERSAIGLENRNSQQDPTYIFMEGLNRKVYRNSQYGFNASATRNGTLDYYDRQGNYKQLKGGIFPNNFFALGYDDVDKKVRAHTDIYGTSNLVNDLDDPVLYDEDVWEGFTTGEVLLSMYAEGYTTASFNFFITEIYGKKGADLSEMSVNNGIKPKLTVDFGDLDKDGLQAIKNAPFPLPTASATDEFGASVKVQTHVYTNYTSMERRSQSIVDGTFTPTTNEEYTLEYKAIDALGNETVQAYPIEVVERGELQLVFETPDQVSATVGQSVQLRNATITGALDNGKIEMTAKHAKETVRIDPEENAFTPLYAGTYTVEYVYSDYAGGATFTDTLTVAGSDTPAILQEAHLPRYFIKGATYTLPGLVGYDFSDDSKQIKATVYVTEGAAQERALSGTSYTIESAGGVNISVRYGITGKSGKSFYTDAVTVPVVDVGFGTTRELTLANYLQGDAFTRTYTQMLEGKEVKLPYIEYATDENKAVSGNAKLELINDGHVNYFGAEFTVPQGKDNFESVTFTLRSVDDRDDVVTVCLRKAEKGTAIEITRNGETVAEGTSTLAFGSDDKHTVSIENGRLSFAGSTLYVKAGDLFDGMAYFTLDAELGGVTGQSAFRLSKLMNQGMGGNFTRDTVQPEAVTALDRNKCEYGKDVVIAPIYAYDFVAPDPTVTCTVKMNGVAVTSKEGVVLDGTQDNSRAYTLAGDIYGTYEISIQVYDGMLRKNVSAKKAIEDETAPVITIGKTVSDAKLNATVKIAEVTVSDNLSAAENITVAVVLVRPDGKFVKAGDSFTASQAGTYRVLYRVMDEAGNVAFAEYTVTVK